MYFPLRLHIFLSQSELLTLRVLGIVWSLKNMARRMLLITGNALDVVFARRRRHIALDYLTETVVQRGDGNRCHFAIFCSNWFHLTEIEEFRGRFIYTTICRLVEERSCFSIMDLLRHSRHRCILSRSGLPRRPA